MEQEFESLTVVNIGKHHYLPGQRGFAEPGRVNELVEAGLVKKVDTADVPKEARADDGQYAEEPATDLATDLARTKTAAELELEEGVSAVSTEQAKADNAQIEKAEEPAGKTSGEPSTQKANADSNARKTKEDKSAAEEATK